MHHLYPLAKGDPLCPLGFHPQVRWPTRCKRCFRDYKEHGGRKREEDNITSSTPSLSSWNSPSSRGGDDEGSPAKDANRGWASSQNLNQESKKDKTDTFAPGFGRTTSSWTSTPNLGGLSDETKTVTFSLTLPRRRPTPADTGQNSGVSETPNVVTVRRPSASPPPPNPTPAHLTINKNDSLAERVRKMQALKAHSNSLEKESSQEREREKTPVKKDRSWDKSKTDEKKDTTKSLSSKEDVNFMMQVKNARKGITKPPIKGGPTKDEYDKNEHSDLDDESSSTTGTTTTEGTLVDYHVQEYQEQIESLKNELDTVRKRCERVEKEKSDILLRRLANLDTTSGKFTGRSSEVLKLQQKLNELQTLNEDLRDEKKSLSLRVKEIEAELEARPAADLAARQSEQLRSKLLAAETLCEELMDENEDMKKELRDMEEEIEEMQDNFREDQADEYSVLRRELEQTTKNCRVLSFKLKKTERQAEQLGQEKADQEKKLLEIVGGQSGLDRVAKIKDLEQELSRSNEVALRLQKDLQEATAKLALQPPANQKKTPTLAAMAKTNSVDGKLSRSSLIRGGSQEDPQQLLRDLQDSLEREADLREQLKNAEEEAINLRKKASRVEDDNESLLLQLKKMATKARTRKLSPTAPVNRLPVEPSLEKDEGISDEEDPAELRILLELNEQEAAVLRRKVEELEQAGDSLKRQVKELTEKVASSNNKNSTTVSKKTSPKANGLSEEKIKVLESEIADLRKKLIEKERNCERLHAELSLTQKRPKGSLIKSKSLDGNGGDQFSLDLKRQLQVIEQEASVLRTKTQSLEVDNEKLHAENKKLQLLSAAKNLRSDKSIEQSTEKMTALETELKEALTLIKDLESFKSDSEKTGKRVTFGGEQTKKDIDKIKLKQEELDKLKQTLTKVESEKDRLYVSLKELKEEAIKSFKPRSPKKPTDFTTKLQLKKMVEDLENEIGEMCVVMKNAEINNSPIKQNEKQTLQKTIEELRSKLAKTDLEWSNEKNRLQKETAQEKQLNLALENERKDLSGKVKSCEAERNKALGDYRLLNEEKKKLEVEVNRLTVDLNKSMTKQSAMADCMKKIEELKRETEEKDKQIDKLKKEIDLAAKSEQDKNKYVKEIGDKTKKIAELEKKIKESDDKCKRTEKLLSARKDRIVKLEKELSEEKEQSESFSSTQRRMSAEWTSEKDLMQSQLRKAEAKLETIEDECKGKLKESESKVLTLESHIAAKITHIEQLEDALRDMTNQKYDDAISPVELAQLKEKLENAQRDLSLKEQELGALKQDVSNRNIEFSKLQDDAAGHKQTILKLQHDHKDVENKLKVQTKDASHWEAKASDLEIDLTAERKKVERMKMSHEKDVKNKEIELATLKGKLRTLEQTSGAGSKKISELKGEFEEKLKKLEHELVVERHEYDELTGKYELLEEEHVVTKARLTVEKETAQGQLVQIQRDLNCANTELKSLQDTYNTKTDAWIKEKIELQEKLSATEERLCGGGWEVEKARLQAKLDEKQKEVGRMKQERDMKLHQQENLKKEHEELRKKLDDYDKVSKVQRNQAIENANMVREIKTLQDSLDQIEKSKRTEVSECKTRYESQAQNMQDELHSLQAQVSRFKRERDTFKNMLDIAQKNLSDLKVAGGDAYIKNKRSSVASIDEECKTRIATLEQQVNCLEDELCETRLLSSKYKTDLISEKSSAEIKLAEMQSKLNEFEEDRLLTSGRTKIPGMRTRMELAWQKERDEQQRLLQETSTLARDLRQTLFEVERERDKERLDMKRRLEQLKRTTEEDVDENKKKVSELQCDLLELRDAHAKLRTTNEKLRRERERHERDKDNQRLATVTSKRQQQEDDRRIGFLLEQIEELIRQTPDLHNKSVSHLNDVSYLSPAPPRRNRSKSRSREATPESGIGENSVQSTLSRIQKAAEELKATRNAQKRQINNRRAASIEPREDAVLVTSITPRVTNGKAPPLTKRSLSLEQTNKDHLGIWKTDDDSLSSMQSLDAELDTRLFTMQRDTSLDSRLSGGSTQSDVQPGDKKKKKGFLGKLKQLTKSRSIDDHAGPDVADFKSIGSMSQGSDSDMSTTGSRKDLRGKLSDMFSRKSGPRSRSTSKERKRELNTPVLQRPDVSQGSLSRNGSSSQIPQLSVRSDSSAASRSTSVTPGMARKKK